MPTAIVTQQINLAGEILSKNKSHVDSAQLTIDEAIDNGQTDDEIAMVLDVSACKAFWISSDQDVLAEFNSASSPVPLITLLADVPYLWHSDDYAPFLLTADVTALFITNASGATANVKVRALYDSTP